MSELPHDNRAFPFRIEWCDGTKRHSVWAENSADAAKQFGYGYCTVDSDDKPTPAGSVYGEFRVLHDDSGDEEVWHTYLVVADGEGGVRELAIDGEDVHDQWIKQLGKTLEATVLGGSILEVHTGSGEDNYVSLMLRDADLEVINRMAAIIAHAEHAFRPLCEAHGWKVLDGPVWLIGHKATHEGHPCVGHPLNKGSRLVTYETWFDCWLDCIEPLEIE